MRIMQFYFINRYKINIGYRCEFEGAMPNVYTVSDYGVRFYNCPLSSTCKLRIIYTKENELGNELAKKR